MKNWKIITIVAIIVIAIIAIVYYSYWKRKQNEALNKTATTTTTSALTTGGNTTDVANSDVNETQKNPLLDTVTVTNYKPMDDAFVTFDWLKNFPDLQLWATKKLGYNGLEGIAYSSQYRKFFWINQDSTLKQQLFVSELPQADSYLFIGGLNGGALSYNEFRKMVEQFNSAW